MNQLPFRFGLVVLLAVLVLTAGMTMIQTQDEPRVLVFSKTAGFRHASIEAGIAALQQLGEEHGFAVDATEDASAFHENNLQQYRAVVFLNTTGDVLDHTQQNDFERYIQAGGGYVGIHSATDTEYDWPWYGLLAGAYFTSHPNNPNVRDAAFRVLDTNHPATEGLPARWERTDEFYNFRDVNPDLNVLIDIDETSYEGGTMDGDHPMSWYHEYDGGRAFYTSMGHTDETYAEPLFLQHLLGGLHYAMGGGELDYSDVRTKRVPEENRFTIETLTQPLAEPMELAVLPDERVLFVERRGAVKLYKPDTGETLQIASIPVSLYYNAPEGEQGSTAEDGLVGMNIDPNFAENGWVYMYYSPLGDEEKNVLSRFTLRGDELDLSSEIVMVEVPVQRDECCHTGGSIDFDAAGNLYVSTGDNTNPHATGYAAIDERPGRGPWDAQKSSANTNDLRGKILRITPQPDGSYTIPEGNLFAPGTPQTRPEIYTMGHRNPYRISVDKHTGFLYWGDIGPDAAQDSVGFGPAGHDEYNQAREAGNYGWPHFVGDNKAYYDVNFATGVSGPAFDPAKPINDSPNNTGLRELPPAQPAYIWYPAGPAPEFPVLGTGGRSAMAGPVYYQDDFADAARPFPDYYDGKLFLLEWMRGTVLAVTMDEAGDYVSMERFMPNYAFKSPMDITFGPNGDLYVLEYGTGWFTGNDDARLLRIQFNEGNRKPVAQLNTDREAGAIPLSVAFSSAGTMDYDNDALTFAWTITNANGTVLEESSEPDMSYAFTEPGIYTAQLAVTDAAGETTTEQTQIVAGNEVADVKIDLGEVNGTFFFPAHPISYQVRVSDAEDGSLEDGGISPDQVAVSVDYLREGYDQVAIAQGHRAADASAAFETGRLLVEAGTCLACHKLNDENIGPSYMEVAEKYEDDPNATDYLATKIREGGSGIWGEVMMPPHPQLSDEEVRQMVAYILSLNAEPAPSLPTAGTYTPDASANQGSVVLRAAYRDRGANGLPGAFAEDVVVLRAPTIIMAEGEASDDISIMDVPQMPVPMSIVERPNTYTRFEQLDLTGVTEIVLGGMAPIPFLNSTGGYVEVRLDAPDGTAVGRTDPITPDSTIGAPSQYRIELTPTTGKHDVYFTYQNDDMPDAENLFVMMTVTFRSGGEAASIGGVDTGLSTRSTLAELLENEDAKAILEEHVPGMTSHPQLDQAMHMTLREIAPFAPDQFTDAVLDAIDADLAGQ